MGLPVAVPAAGPQPLSVDILYIMLMYTRQGTVSVCTRARHALQAALTAVPCSLTVNMPMDAHPCYRGIVCALCMPQRGATVSELCACMLGGVTGQWGSDWPTFRSCCRRG
jgi:hypothetical protein